MAHVYSLTGKKISLAESPDDIGLHFSTPEHAARALRSLQTAAKKQVADGADSHRAAPRHFGRTVLLHKSGVAHNPAAAIRNTLSPRHLKHVQRTSPVYIERHTQLRVVTTREINVRFKAKVTKSQRLKVLKNLNLRILAPNEFHPDHY